jgi:hypothetical protein
MAETETTANPAPATDLLSQAFDFLGAPAAWVVAWLIEHSPVPLPEALVQVLQNPTVQQAATVAVVTLGALLAYHGWAAWRRAATRAQVRRARADNPGVFIVLVGVPKPKWPWQPPPFVELGKVLVDELGKAMQDAGFGRAADPGAKTAPPVLVLSYPRQLPWRVGQRLEAVTGALSRRGQASLKRTGADMLVGWQRYEPGHVQLVAVAPEGAVSPGVRVHVVTEDGPTLAGCTARAFALRLAALPREAEAYQAWAEDARDRLMQHAVALLTQGAGGEPTAAFDADTRAEVAAVVDACGRVHRDWDAPTLAVGIALRDLWAARAADPTLPAAARTEARFWHARGIGDVAALEALAADPGVPERMRAQASYLAPANAADAVQDAAGVAGLRARLAALPAPASADPWRALGRAWVAQALSRWTTGEELAVVVADGVAAARVALALDPVAEPGAFASAVSMLTRLSAEQAAIRATDPADAIRDLRAVQAELAAARARLAPVLPRCWDARRQLADAQSTLTRVLAPRLPDAAREEKVALREAALTAANAALAVADLRARQPALFAGLSAQRGVALAQLGRLQGLEARLESGIKALRDAAEVWAALNNWGALFARSETASSATDLARLQMTRRAKDPATRAAIVANMRTAGADLDAVLTDPRLTANSRPPSLQNRADAQEVLADALLSAATVSFTDRQAAIAALTAAANDWGEAARLLAQRGDAHWAAESERQADRLTARAALEAKPVAEG